MKKGVILLAVLLTVSVGHAQEYEKRAWEIGIGGSAFNFNRFSVTEFITTDEGHYIDMQMRHTVFGGNIYVARELTNVFALDFQGTVGFTKSRRADSWHKEMLWTGGLGLQWRLGHYFNSRYIDPYLRVGGNYMYKSFDILYGNSLNGMDWNMANDYNKEGADGRHLFTVAAGAGVNMWLNDRFGIGIQGDYIVIPKPNVANSLQGTVRLMWRFGGKSTFAPPVIQYVDRPVEVERVVEKIVEVPGKEILLINLFNNIFFDFDKATLTDDSEVVLDRIAETMNENSDDRFLISGFTDSRGSEPYNQNLSEQRAKAVVDALVSRGVSKSVLKARGAGERIAIADTEANDDVRRGDRKVTIEIVTNLDYWDYLQDRLY